MLSVTVFENLDLISAFQFHEHVFEIKNLQNHQVLSVDPLSNVEEHV